MSRTVRSILFGVTLGVLLALLIAPQSGWLVRFQALSQFPFVPLPGYHTGDTTPAEQRRINTVAAAHPNDYQLQYAATRWNLESLRALETRFPDSASLRANILRKSCIHEVRTDREEEHLLVQTPAPHNYENDLPKVDPKQLSAFDQDAAAGERLDPDNAYFPLMRAVGFYAGHRDSEAQAAILRAGTKTQWKEYWDDEVAGHTRLHALAFGDHSAVWHIAVVSTVMLPHYARLRAVARIATYQAMRDEQAGSIKQGGALRHALIHCGGLMRAQSQLLIGSLVGISLAQIAMQRPGGAPWITESYTHGEPVPTDSPTLTKAYVAYVRRFGLEAEAHYALAEGAADQQVRATLPPPNNLFTFIYGGLVQHLVWCWVTGLILLSVILWLLLLRALTAALALFPPVREEWPLPGWVYWGAAAGTLAAVGELLFIMLTLNETWNNLSAMFLVVLLLVIITLPILFLWRMQGRQFQRRSIKRGLGIAVLTCAGWCGIYALAQWQSTGPQEVIGLMRALTGNLDDSGTSGGTSALHLFAPLVPLAVPLLLVVTLAVISRARHVPLLAGLISGYRALCLPLTCVLLLAYGAVVLKTLHQERILDDTLTRSLNGAGTYLAAREGQVWPGVVSSTPAVPALDARLDRHSPPPRHAQSLRPTPPA